MVEEGIHKYGIPLIYKITSPSNKIYIGQTWNWISRKSKYKKLRCGEQIHIYRSLVKYGFENHKIEIVETLPIDCSQEKLDEREIYWWQHYKDLEFEMLNLKEPGRGGRMSEESKKKMSIANSGENNPMFGKKGKDHPAFGYIGYWKGKTGEQHIRFGTKGELSPLFGRTGDKHPMFGLRGGKSPFAKKVIDTNTNIVYPSAKDASKETGINYTYLTGYLRRKLKGEVFNSKYSMEYLIPK